MKPVSIIFILFLSGLFLFARTPALSAEAAPTIERIEKTEAEWAQILTKDQFRILRKEGTERAYSSSLLDEKRDGIYSCAGCDLPLFSSITKYKSGTGWPSFYAPLESARIGFKEDRKLWTPRTEVHCARCGGHLGHVFKDGPQPTGLRYCLNGLALTFKPMPKAKIPQQKSTISRKDIKH